MSGLLGISDTRLGMQYYFTCKVFLSKNILAEYHGESWSNMVNRLLRHANIVNKNIGNAMAKHLTVYHKKDPNRN